MENLIKIKNYIKKEEKRITLREGKREALIERISELEKSINSEEEVEELNRKTAELLKQSSMHARRQAIEIIEHLVTKCLQYIFQNNIRFIIKDKDNQKSEVEFYVTDENGDEKYLTKPDESRGGGIVDIVSLGLRIAISELLKNKIGGPLVFDEPSKYVSQDYIGNVGLFLKNISVEFDRQIIMVTHNDYLSNIGDKIYSVELIDGISKVTTLTKNDLS